MSEPSGQNVRMLTDRQRLAWLRLIRSENVGPATFRDLINHFGSAEAAIAMLPELAQRGGVMRRIVVTSQEDAERELEIAAGLGARFVAVGEPDYPPLLRRMDQPPPLIALKGIPEVTRRPAISIVGARNASLSGSKFARQIAEELGYAGYVVASGLARGIDAAAHRGSIETGTIAVLAGGLDKPYPPENLELCADIAEQGAIVTEMPFGWTPRAQDFPRRNRLIAGLSYGLVVVEAAQRSGSLISARLAGELGRLVFAVPGSPLDPRAAGANHLLKEGAILVTAAEDILTQIAPLTGSSASGIPSFKEPSEPDALPPPADTDRDRLIQALGPTPVPVDDLIRHTGLHPSQVFLILLELDLAGRLERHSGGSVSLVLSIV